jgi:hypothetical protein
VFCGLSRFGVEVIFCDMGTSPRWIARSNVIPTLQPYSWSLPQTPTVRLADIEKFSRLRERQHALV